jgi:hypothetical protein
VTESDRGKFFDQSRQPAAGTPGDQQPESIGADIDSSGNRGIIYTISCSHYCFDAMNSLMLPGFRPCRDFRALSVLGAQVVNKQPLAVKRYPAVCKFCIVRSGSHIAPGTFFNTLLDFCCSRGRKPEKHEVLQPTPKPLEQTSQIN